MQLRYAAVPSKPSMRLVAWILAFSLAFAFAAEAADKFERRSLALVNEHRAAKGEVKLEMNRKLYRLAKEHSDYMAARNQMSHDGFDSRFAKSGFSHCVENVGWNHPTPESLVKAWKRSATHNANMLNSRIRQAGLARSGAYVTFFACG